MNDDTLKQAVRMKQGIECLSIRDLNKLVGAYIVGTQPSYIARSAIRDVAKEEFVKEYGKAQLSWVDKAEQYCQDTEANFILESLHGDRIERL